MKNIDVQKSTLMYNQIFISQKTKNYNIRENNCLSYFVYYLYYTFRNMINKKSIKNSLSYSKYYIYHIW